MEGRRGLEVRSDLRSERSRHRNAVPSSRGFPEIDVRRDELRRCLSARKVGTEPIGPDRSSMNLIRSERRRQVVIVETVPRLDAGTR